MALKVELVSADQLLWAGEATQVVAHTADGDMGVMAGHVPVLGVLVPSSVKILTTAGETVMAHVEDGFFSVDHDNVTIVTEKAALTVS